ncbi:hypothetical protein NEICINOT_03322 [Neisseria cinerea ATCC 14685]|uniref:Uncharacterized protein n=1 Tax=Neisseria cinerea ATCC 14685 TaxID=546262 RepID=D0W103_NEICI|nr:hypothetical protein NEICINOT_03322 [Neisseria cinerea ATCC 14685]
MIGCRLNTFQTAFLFSNDRRGVYKNFSQIRLVFLGMALYTVRSWSRLVINSFE